MPVGNRLSKLLVRPHLSRRTIRMRLTLLYGSLFLLCGAGLLAITYGLVVHATRGVVFNGQNGAFGITQPPGGTPGPTVESLTGTTGLTPDQLQAQAEHMRTQALQQHAAELHQLRIQSATALAVMVVVSIVLGWIAAGRVLRPLRTITRSAQEITATNLHRRLALRGPGLLPSPTPVRRQRLPRATQPPSPATHRGPGRPVRPRRHHRVAARRP
jgi:hypothetical protein